MKPLTLLAVLILAVSVSGETIRQRVIEIKAIHNTDSDADYVVGYEYDTTYIEHEVCDTCEFQYPWQSWDVDTCYLNQMLNPCGWVYVIGDDSAKYIPCVPETTIACDTMWLSTYYLQGCGDWLVDYVPVIKCDTSITGRR